MEELHISSHSRRLAQPIDVNQLSKDGCELVFTKSGEDFEESYDAEHDFKFEDVLKYAKLDLLDGTTSLSQYKEDMVPVPHGPHQTEDTKLMKRIKEKGVGEQPVPGAHVRVHYMYYTELQEIPIDITYLRKSMPEKFQLGASGLIPAFEYAILSMKKGEKADFFASYELCFGVLGCPPRIPAKADLLFEVQLISFSVDPDFGRTSADMESDVLAKNQSEEPQFERVMKRAKELGAIGSAAFNDKNVVGAARRYREAVQLLLNTQVDNHETQMQLEEYLCKVYRNLMICYNSSKKFKVSCDCANKALQFANSFASKDVKLFFLWGKALNGIQEWKNAMKQLKTALRLATRNSEKAEIGKEIRIAEEKYKAYQIKQKSQFKRMFSEPSVRLPYASDSSSEPSVRTPYASDPSSVANVRIPYAEHEAVRPGTLKEISDRDQDLDHQDDTGFERLMEINMSEFKMTEGVYEEDLGATSSFSKYEIEILRNIAKKIGLTFTVDKNVVISKKI